MTPDFKALAAPFAPDRVSWRVGSTNKEKTKGMALGFIDARDVMDRLDAVCGPAGWQCRYSHAEGKTVCDIAIKCGDEWVWKADGAGDTDFEAEKGALSDSFKRGAVRWGIGRYLYDLPSPWVEIEPMGAKSHKIKDHERTKLARIAAGAFGANPAPGDKPSAQHTATAPKTISLADRAAALEKALNAAAGDRDKLRNTYARASGLCADLDTKDPEKLVEINALYERLFNAAEEVFA